MARPLIVPPPSEQPKADPAPQQVETVAPKAIPAPPAPLAQSDAPDSWEGRVLARLEKFRRYPGAARSTRQQGVVYIRSHINRDGRVLTSSLVRSSGYPALDRAALETLRRADPLPRIPADRPDEVELAVPIEFFIR
ncbi:energy transducer TonB [Flavisphingomonas formosensis]|uniref:energy transducer TonB n=1 Tax=Flavisphingomonas formosensis TaxID=861534 RepID=UPI0022B75C2B|nr:energy transducer TonB [Sphingomonas formosensis]